MSREIMARELTDEFPIDVPADAPLTSEQKARVRQPMIIGAVVVAVFVVGMLVWAGVSSIAEAVPAPGFVEVAVNRKTVRQLDGGVIRSILVQEGQSVHKGQPLIIFDDTQARAQLDVLQNQYDADMAQLARLEAEVSGATSVTFPPELTSRQSDPAVAKLMKSEQTLFATRLLLYQTQSRVLTQRIAQQRAREGGLQAQVKALDAQSGLIQDELNGVQSLYDQGLAPKSRLSSLQRNAASLGGDRGARIADIAQAQEAGGEVEIQLASLRDQRESESASDLKDVQTKLADVVPRLRAAQATLDRTVVRSPADGDVLQLSQYTEGGVANAGDTLMQVVPTNSAMIIKAQVKPNNIAHVRDGLHAQVRLTAYNRRTTPPLDAKVINVSADRLLTEKGDPYFEVELAVDPKELGALGSKVELTPGMPASAMIITGHRSILDYLVGPFTAAFDQAMHEE